MYAQNADQDFQRELEDKSMNLIIRKLEGARVGEDMKVITMLIIIIKIDIIIKTNVNEKIKMRHRQEMLRQAHIIQEGPSTNLNR